MRGGCGAYNKWLLTSMSACFWVFSTREKCVGRKEGVVLKLTKKWKPKRKSKQSRKLEKKKRVGEDMVGKHL